MRSTRFLIARRFAALGTLMIACGIALLAIASHAGESWLRPSLATAAVLLANGLGLLALHCAHALRYCRWPITVGALLFAVSVLIGAALGVRAQPAPLGGILMIVGWLIAGAELLCAKAEADS